MNSVTGALEEIQSFSDEARIENLGRVVSAYQDVGLIAGDEAVRLSTRCPRCTDCWAAPMKNLVPEPTHDAVALPWIGSHFKRDRVLLVGMNFHDCGGLREHWHITRSHISSMQQGKPGHDGRPYAARAMSAVKAVLEARAGLLHSGWAAPENTALADVWQSVAYTQAVKCAPKSVRSEPNAAMFRNCPDLVLLEELRTLKPNVVIVMGRSKLRDQIRPLLRHHASLEWDSAYGSLERDHFELNGERTELICMNHPSSQNSRHWQASLDQLVSSLLDKPA